MVYNTRIAGAFVDTVAIYAPEEFTVDGNRFSTGNERFTATPTYSAVQCRFDGRKEISQADPQGRSNELNMDTSDQLRVLASQHLEDGWAVQLLTAGHPLYGQWFYAQGNGQPLNWRAGIKIYILKRGNKPPGVA